MGIKIDEVIGLKFNKLTIIAFSHANKYSIKFFVCKCDCGNIKLATFPDLKREFVLQCKECENLEKSKGMIRHGHSLNEKPPSPEYHSWSCMRTRVNNSKIKGAQNYSLRGITICNRWNSFENFLADMGPRPKGTSLDRINNDGNYEPSNCKWSTPKEQVNNSRRVKNKKKVT